MPTVLVIDDNLAVHTALSVLFSIHNIDVLACESPAEGIALLRKEPIDLIIQDMNFAGDTTSGEEGIELFHTLREIDPDVPVILLTAWTHLEQAVELVKAGAADYLAKPWDDQKLCTTTSNLLALGEAKRRERQQTDQRRKKRDALATKYDLCGLCYESDAMFELLSLAVRVAPTDVPVLITGPNGAGKEKIAEIVQANSAASSGPFIKVNAGALPGDLIESELFGSSSGAYTGASDRIGRFEAANNGTLFLDEIGNLPLSGQAKLLRVLQTGEFERLGSTKTQSVKVRIISATNANLRQLVKDGKFREDLFYRLNLIELTLPPLADRSDDILPLAEYFLENQKQLDKDAKHALLHYSWPGNVRELQNTLRRASIIAHEPYLSAGDLKLPIDQPQLTHVVGVEPDEDTVKQALLEAQGVVAKAARQLGMSRQALYRRMEKFGIDRAGT